MALNTGSGSVNDWLDHIAQDHFLTLDQQFDETEGPSDAHFLYFNDSGQDVYVLGVRFGTELYIGAGDKDYTADKNDEFPSGVTDYWQDQSGNNGLFNSLDDNCEWWWASGSSPTSWFWSVVYDQDNNNAAYLAWQVVDQYWSYPESERVARVATMYEADGDGWTEGGPGWCAVDTPGGWLDDRDEFTNNAGELIGGLTEDNTWLVLEPTKVKQTYDGTAPIGEVNAWGIDRARSSPEHRSEIDCSGKTWIYLSPGTADPELFFRVS